MEITLVLTVNGDEVHGTDNDKRTGCGINLVKPENVTRYRRGGTMNDLKEITCERCKNVLAKKIIKADKKEMVRLIKEEKARAKKGIEDENIVPLGNTVAKITRSPEEIRAEEEKKRAEQKAAAAEKKAAEERAAAEKKAAEERAEAERKAAEEKAAAVQKTIPGTGIAIDDDLAAFAISVPKEEENAPANNLQDDFLAQFAIKKPQEEPEEEKSAVASPVQDDFLAQFAIPSPVQEEAPAPAPEAAEHEAKEISAAEPAADEMGDIFTAADEAPVSDYAPAPSGGYYPQAAEETVEAAEDAAEEASDDDIMKMFSIGGDASTGMEVLSETEPVETSIYDNDDEVIDVHEHELADDNTYYGDNGENSDETEAEKIAESSEWDYVANQLFGFAGVEMPEISADETVPETQEEKMPEVSAEKPEIEDIAAPEVPAEEPEIEDIAAPEVPAEEPEIEEIAAPEAPAEEPEIEETAAPEAPAEEPEIEDIAAPEVPAEEPEIEEIAAPEAPAGAMNSVGDFDVNKYRYSAPVFADEKTEEQPEAPVQPQMTAPEQPSVITVPQFAGYDMNGQPIYNYVQMQLTGYDMNGQPIFAPVQPMNIPVQPVVPVQTAAPVQPMTAPVQSAAPVQPAAPAPVQPMTVPVQPNASYRTPTANISKIATNPHSKPIPKSFVNALANSREQGKKNLIETQGMNQMPVLDSIEDVLSQMGDEAAVQKRKEAQNVPVFEEYKTPARSTAAKAASSTPAEPQRPLTKAELKAKKKQDKIDAKFMKDLAKRGF